MASLPPSTPLPPSPLDTTLLVKALHDFTPPQQADPTGSTANSASAAAGNGQVLALKAGELIRCYNKDPSGWWDGELVESGQRGWFPSNYVSPVAGDGTAEQQQPQQFARSRSVSPTDTTHSRRSVSPRFRSVAATGGSWVSAAGRRGSLLPTSDGEGSSAVMDSLEHALHLLQTAAEAGRSGHYQPSTACVISSIRTLLSSTSCLTRDSSVLRQHPSMAQSRKRILSALALLVNQARKASSPSIASKAEREFEEGEMLAKAEGVRKEAMTFVEEAQRLGVQCVLPSPSIDGGSPVDARKGSLDEIGESVAHLAFKGGSRQASSAAGAGIGIGLLGVQTDGGTLSTAGAGPGPKSPASADNPPLSPTTMTIRSPAALLDHLSATHDTLLSTLAAFIGHTHAHTRAAHSSSYAQLIDLTREAIERVRGVLVVVEAVANSPKLVGQEAEDGELSEARERLYVATTGLVTAARVATSPSAAAGTSNGVASPGEDEEERRALLSSATAVLRSGGDCVAAVKAVVRKRWREDAQEGGDIEVVLRLTAGQVRQHGSSVTMTPDTATLSPNPSPGSSPTNERPRPSLGAPAMAKTSSKERRAAGRKGSHTLSMLGRKATSLNCLRDMYEEQARQEDGDVAEVDETEDDEEEEAYDDAPESRRQSAVSPVPEGTGAALMARDRTLSASSSSGTTETITDNGSTSSAFPSSAMSAAHGLAHDGAQDPTRAKKQSSTSTHSAATTASSAAMSRGDSERTSESGLSSDRHSGSGFSRTSTTNTSPRSSLKPHPSTGSGVFEAMPAVPSSGLAVDKDMPPPPPKLASSASSSIAGPPASSKTPVFLQRDYEPREISFNADGHVTGGTLRCLVERMTLHDTTIDPSFSNTFFLTFRLFTTPTELAETLYRRFDISPQLPDGGRPLTPDELKQWTAQKLTPIRLRIYNLFKTWVETHWQHKQDCEIVDGLLGFCRGRLAAAMSSASTRLIDLVQKRVVAASMSNSSKSAAASPVAASAPVVQHRGLTRMQSTERFRAGKILPMSTSLYSSSVPAGATGPMPPAPVVNKALLAHLRSASTSSFGIMEIDSVELARQLTIMESRVYCAIRAEELLGMEFSKKGSGVAVNVRAMSTLSTRLTGWVSETILGEQDTKKRTALLKYFVKLSERCHELNNYNTLFALLAALNSSTISRLKKTWDGLAPKYRAQLETLRKATEHSRNYAEYRQKIRSAVPPCLPFVGLFLTDLTMCSEGNPPQRPSPGDPKLQLINFDRYQKMARIIGDLQRFQVAYNLLEVPEIQTYLSRCLEGLAHGGDATSLYRQSLLVEPRDPQLAAPSINSMSSSKHGDFFNWRG